MRKNRIFAGVEAIPFEAPRRSILVRRPPPPAVHRMVLVRAPIQDLYCQDMFGRFSGARILSPDTYEDWLPELSCKEQLSPGEMTPTQRVVKCETKMAAGLNGNCVRCFDADPWSYF